ncbi:hypothetical protein ACW2QC_19025 [Virgibacillus sp. FSP13]
MRKLFFLLTLLSLVACDINSDTSEVVIDWVDFVNIDGEQYQSLHTVKIADSRFIGAEIGQVDFQVDENISNPSYKPKDGDAAFLKKGTKLYQVKDMPNLLAVRDEHEINGYKIYQNEDSKANWNYQHMNKDTIEKIEIYEGYTNPKPLHAISGEKEIDRLIQLLDEGKTSNDFTPDISEGDPVMYHMVFYHDKPISYQFTLQFDGDVWFWSPDHLQIVPDEIGDIILAP